MRSRLLVVGGRQRKKALDLDEWHAYEKAVIVEVDLESFSASCVFEYETPVDHCPREFPSIVFKAGELDDAANRLLVCTQTEILELDTKSWRTTFSFSHPCFNDLHHACYFDSDHIVVANTGLDQVLKIELDRTTNSFSKIVNEWTCCSSETWDRFDPKIDYRQVPTTKPHEAHPNFVFSHQGRIYATRFHQKDAVDVDGLNSSFDIEVGNPHDGIVCGNEVTFTTTNGFVVTHDLATGKCLRKVDLNAIHSNKPLLGWCRGICVDKDSSCWVGFSRIRPTWLRKNLSWIKQGFRSKGQYGMEPTRIAEYDLKGQSMIRELNLENVGVNAIFGIYREELDD